MNVTLNAYASKHIVLRSLGFSSISPSNYVSLVQPNDTFERRNVSGTSAVNFRGQTQIDSTDRPQISALQSARLSYQPKMPPVFDDGICNLQIQSGAKTKSAADQSEIQKLFKNTYGQPVLEFSKSDSTKSFKPVNVGVILSGGQAPGGHNVITGIYDAIKQANPESKVYGFLGGPSGIINGDYVELNDKMIDSIRNTGGFDAIGSGRTKIETEDQFNKTLNNCKKLNLSAITMIGGDDSNTNAAVLAEWFLQKNEPIQVIGCPKTIDGDLKNDQIEVPFGFDTATKTYSEIVGNIEKDANSAKKYWHFIKIMGRSASHVALETSLQTHPNITLLSEEVEKNNTSLNEIVDNIADVVAQRAKNGKNFGVVIVPEGLIEHIPEMKSMISGINDSMGELDQDPRFTQSKSSREKFAAVESKLSEKDAKTFNSLPSSIKKQLLLDRDPHGNIQVSKIDTEKLLIDMVNTKLDKMKKQGEYDGKFSTQAHFIGYEGRAAFPTNFDCDYCYSLGYSAAALINYGVTGYLASVKNLEKDTKDWVAGGVPLTMMMDMEKRNGHMKPVIQKSLVDLNGPVYKKLEKNRDDWAMNDKYVYPGPIQYFGPDYLCDAKDKTLCLEHKNKKQ